MILLKLLFYGFKAFFFQWKSAEQIRSYQERRLRFIVKHAYGKSAYYRKKFDEHGVKPEDIKTLEDIVKLPLITKDELREHFNEIICEGYNERNSIAETTSGSSGKLLPILHDKETRLYIMPIAIRPYLNIGLSPFDTEVIIRYFPQPINIIHKFGLFKFVHISSTLSEAEIIEKIKRIRPKAIRSYPEKIDLVARSISDEDTRSLNLKYIVTWSCMLTPKVRERVQKKFGCPVYDFYAAAEFHDLANECRGHKMHIAADNVYIEFIKDGHPARPGAMGEIVVTSLRNKAMPFIRYRLGDLGASMEDQKCVCGGALPIMKSLEGRVDDRLMKTDGTMVTPFNFINAFKEFQATDEVHEFQVVQTQKNRVLIMIVKGKNYNNQIEDIVRAKIVSALGDVQVDFEYLEHIQRTPGETTIRV